MRNRIMRATVSRTLVDNAEQTATEKHINLGTKERPNYIRMSAIKMKQILNDCTFEQAKSLIRVKLVEDRIRWEFRQLGGQND